MEICNTSIIKENTWNVTTIGVFYPNEEQYTKDTQGNTETVIRYANQTVFRWYNETLFLCTCFMKTKEI